jgi:hypothetical protein
MRASKPRPVRTDWLAIKIEYVSGNDTLEDVASRHDLSPDVVRRHSALEDWAGERAEFRARVTRGAIRAAVRARVRSEAEIDAALHAVSAESFPELVRALRKRPASAQLNGVLRAAALAYRLQRESAGLPPEKPPVPVRPPAESVVRVRLQGPDGSELTISEGPPSPSVSEAEPPKPASDDSGGS